MTADPTPKTGHEAGTGHKAGEAPPGGVRRDARKLLRELDGPVDEHFKQSVAGLSSQLGERAARQSTSDPRAAAEARRAALQAYDLARAQRWKTALRAAGVVVATVGVACFTVFIAMPPDQPSPRPMASRERAVPIELAAVEPTPATIPAPPPAANTPSPPVPPAALAIEPVVAEVAPVTASEPAPVGPAPVGPASAEPPPLRRDEVREVQTKLYSFGFNPGPIDGAVGSMTRAAIAQYQQNRDQPQTGTVDRELLEQLRQDPAPQVAAPQVAQRSARPGPARATGSSAARSSDPFEPLRTAANRFEQWVQSLGR